MSWFIIRIIAMVTMLIDHIGWNFIDNPIQLTWIWRIAFPCYAFLLAEGFYFIFKDKKKLLKHLSTLIILAIVSEPCYDLLEFGSNIFSRYMESQSVIITLLLWFLGMSLTELFIPSENTNSEKTNLKNMIVLFLSYILIWFANYKIWANFNFVWPLLIIAFYRYLRYARNKEKTENTWPRIKRFSILLLIFIGYLIIYFWFRSWLWSISEWIWQIKQYSPRILGYIISAFILSLSNCKLWYHKKWFRYLYTTFYPIHALIIWIIIVLLSN